MTSKQLSDFEREAHQLRKQLAARKSEREYLQRLDAKRARTKPSDLRTMSFEEKVTYWRDL